MCVVFPQLQKTNAPVFLKAVAEKAIVHILHALALG